MSLIESAAEKYVTNIVYHFFFCIPLSSYEFVSPLHVKKNLHNEGFNFMVLMLTIFRTKIVCLFTNMLASKGLLI